MIGVTQNAQAVAAKRQSRSFAFDMLGRLVSETSPEMNNASIGYTYDVLSSDVSCGTYTSAGNIIKRVDAAGNVTCYTGYDALDRGCQRKPLCGPERHQHEQYVRYMPEKALIR